MKARTALLAAAASIALAAGPVLANPALASEQPSAVRFLGGCRAQGDFAICSASGNVRHPHSIFVHVIARPGQNVSGAWTVVCSKGSGAGSKSGKFQIGRAHV